MCGEGDLLGRGLCWGCVSLGQRAEMLWYRDAHHRTGVTQERKDEMHISFGC